MKGGWVEKPISQCFRVKSGDFLPKKAMCVGTVDVYGGNGVTGKHDAINLTGENIVIGRVGAYCGNVRHVNGDAWVTDNAFYISECFTPFDYRYLSLLLDFKQLRNTANQAAQPVISYTTIKDLLLQYPPVPEQKRIVGILDEAFDGISTAKANAEKNLQNARALFESYLSGEYAEKAFLGDLVNIKTGKLDANAAVEGGQYPFFTCSRQIFAIDNHAFDCEAILLAGNNAVGDFNVKHYKGKFNAYQRTYVITVNEKRRVLYRFLYFQMLKSLKKFKAQSVGAGTKFLKLGMIKDMEIALPSLVEQERVVETMDSLREQTEQLETIYQQKLTALDELKKSLLDQAFTGQL